MSSTSCLGRELHILTVHHTGCASYLACEGLDRQLHSCEGLA